MNRSPLSPELERADAAYRHGRLDEAEALCRDALTRDPRHAGALHLGGLVALAKGRLVQAAALVRKAIRRAPNDAAFHMTLGRILNAMEHPDAAVAALRRAVELAPDAAEAHCNLAAALVAVGDHAAAAEAGRRATMIWPDFALAHFYRGVALQALGTADAAADCYRQAIGCDPSLAEAHNNLGNILKDARDLDAAEAALRAAVAARPHLAEAHLNLGALLYELGEFSAAQAAFDRAVDLAPDNAEAHRNRAMVLLLQGRFAEGWAEYEWRWRTRHFAPVRRSFAVPRWAGGDLGGRRILVHAEQGFGDTLQFVRYVPHVAARGGRVVLECAAALAGLLRTVDGVAEVVAAGTPLPAIDCHVPLLSLPGIFGTDFETIPAEVPYVSVDPMLATEWRRRLAGGRPQVGVAWRGAATYKRDRVRSPGLQAVRPLFDVPGVDFYALQKDGGSEDLAAAGLGGRVADLTPAWRDFADSAAMIGSLDLVVAPDTAIAHLAGALGATTWVMLPYAPEWRWLTEREDSPWYPSVRLFRQSTVDDWTNVVACMTAALRRWVRGPAG